MEHHEEKDGRLAEAVALREKGEREEARERLVALAAEYPDDAEIAYQTAWAHDVLGLEAAAVPYYERALAGSGLDAEDRRGRSSVSAAPSGSSAGTRSPSPS